MSISRKTTNISAINITTESIIYDLLNGKISKENAIDIITDKIISNQKAFIRELLIKLYSGNRDAFIEDFEKYVAKVTLLNSVSLLTADERKHILAVINSLVNGDLTRIW